MVDHSAEGAATTAAVGLYQLALANLGSPKASPERTKKTAWAHPVVIGGKLYIRDQDNLFCFDVKAK